MLQVQQNSTAFYRLSYFSKR